MGDSVLATNTRSYVLYLDMLRISAMFAVVILHTAASNWSSADVHSLAWGTFNLYDGVVRWGRQRPLRSPVSLSTCTTALCVGAYLYLP